VNFPVGTIIYFTPFYFPNGKSAPKNKYFIVLQHDGDEWLVASLPTSVDRVPDGIAHDHGCVHLPKAMFSAYIYEPDKPVTNEGWGFPLTTYVYISWVERFDKRIFREVYVVEGVDYTVIGRLTKQEYTALLTCALGSGELKNRFRKELQNARY
jgi:hypothetical protein